MVFSAWLVLLAESSLAFDLSLRRTEGSSGSLPWFWISFPPVSVQEGLIDPEQLP